MEPVGLAVAPWPPQRSPDPYARRGRGAAARGPAGPGPRRERPRLREVPLPDGDRAGGATSRGERREGPPPPAEQGRRAPGSTDQRDGQPAHGPVPGAARRMHFTRRRGPGSTWSRCSRQPVRPGDPPRQLHLRRSKPRSDTFIDAFTTAARLLTWTRTPTPCSPKLTPPRNDKTLSRQRHAAR